MNFNTNEQKMTFIYSIGLLAITGILVPLVIHLWNVKEGKTLKIGSIALLGESSRQSSKSLRIKDWLLFLLRCLLIILIAFIIAQPFVSKRNNDSAKTGWIMVKKENLKTVYHQDKNSIDTLLLKGYEIHDFNIGFESLNLSDTSTEVMKSPQIPVSSLIKQLNSQLSSGFKVQLYTSGYLNNLNEELPETHIDFKINNIQTKDSLYQKVVGAYWSNKDSLKVLMMNSNLESTTYKLKSYNPLDKELLTKTEDGELFLSAKNQNDFIKAEREAINISIYSDNSKDEEYLTAALKAIRDFSQRKINIQANAGIAQADWLFWLSEKPFQGKLKSGAKLFQYQAGKPMEINTNLIFENQQDANVDVFQKVAANEKSNQILWSDGFGEPILSLAKNNGIENYHFYSRLNPKWTNLVWNEVFVKALLPLILASPDENGFEISKDDKRQVAQNQLFIRGDYTKTRNINLAFTQALDEWFWLAAFTVFLLERILTYKAKAN